MARYMLKASGTLPGAWVWVLIISMLLAGVNALQSYVHLSALESAILLFAGVILTVVLKFVEKAE
jgi:hypothetical protein